MVRCFIKALEKKTVAHYIRKDVRPAQKAAPDLKKP
jgi:hypothetical protein